MHKIPCNVVQTIASFLEFNDKINCILVCKEWHRWILNKLLYRSLHFRSNSYKLKQSLEFFNTRGFLASQVESLSMNDCILDDRSLNLITRVLPNLKTLIWVEKDGRRSNIKWAHIGVIFRIYGWKKLEYLLTDATTLNSLSLLGAGSSLSNLATLVINFDGIASPQDVLRTLSHKMRFANCLEELGLYSTVLNLRNMEEIHQNTPCLKIFTLNRVELLMDHHLMSVVLKADKMRTFRMKSINAAVDLYNNDQPVNIADWLTYFGSKYPDITKLYLKTESLDEPSLSPCVASLVSRMKHLTAYATQLCSLTSEILKAMGNIRLSVIVVWCNKDDVDQQTQALSRWSQKIYLETFLITINEPLKPGSLIDLLALIPTLCNLKSLEIKNVPMKLNDVSLILLLNDHPSLTDIYVDHWKIREISLKLTVKKAMDLSALTITIYTYELANHANVSTTLNEILGSQPYHFNIIKIYGDVLCGYGAITIPLTKADELYKLEIQLFNIGYFCIYKTKKGFDIWDMRRKIQLNEPNSEATHQFTLHRKWALDRISTLKIQY